MNAQEKAKQLLDKYLVLANDPEIELREQTAKTCSLFCVKQIQELLDEEIFLSGDSQNRCIKYWKDVIVELNAL